jgi:rubrerythrin
MNAPPVIATLPEFLAHALAIELEAMARYRDLADQMVVHRNAPTAELFSNLARLESQHAQQLHARASAIVLPSIAPWDYRWPTAESPESAPFASAHFLMTPYHALALALEAEERARAFFTDIAANTPSAEVRAMAEELAREEVQHVAAVRRLLAQEPPPPDDWAESIDPPTEPE